MAKISDYLRKFVLGEDKKLQHCGSCLGVIIPRTVLEAFNLGEENRDIKVYMTKEGVLICPKQQ